MTQQSTKRAKFVYVNYEDIQRLINEGRIDINDIVYTKDTHENIFIGTDLSINPIRSKVYRFSSIIAAENKLNAQTDTYEGQIVAILNDGSYTAYIVNKNKSNLFYVTKLSADANSMDYDNLGNRPINNMDGTLSNPVILSGLPTGMYKVRGQYKMTVNDETTCMSSSGTLFFVESSEAQIYVRKITAKEITGYVISTENYSISESSIPTKDWLQNEGYAKETYVDEKIAALEIMSKNDIENYVDAVVNNKLDALIDQKLDSKLDERLVQVEDSDIQYLF